MNMQPNDDEKFENFLRQFQPRAPRPLIEPLERVRQRPLRFVGWAAAVAAMVLVVLISTVQRGPEKTGSTVTIENSAGADQLTSQQSLTIAGANAALAQAPSVKAAIDQMTFQAESRPLP